MKRLLLFLALLFAAPALAQPRVTAPVGTVEGVEQGGLRIFRGIPYAQPPVGPLRWKPPVAAADWQGVRKATAFGPACVQPRNRNAGIYTNPLDTVSEDCLSLNIWAPPWIHTNTGSSLPPGGALVAGYSHETMYDGARLAQRGNMIVVSINYRLGILGYLAHPELSAELPDGVSGNYGLLDQIAALKWVQRNIAAFGGDAGNVTIAGESAGALSILYLMASPQARGLFHKAVAQSAYMITTPELKQGKHGLPSAEAAGSQVMEAVGARDLAGLRAMDAEKLTIEAATKGYGPWGTIDGKTLTRQLVATWDHGQQAKVPVLAGFNAGEIRSLPVLLPPAPASAEAYEAAIRARYGELADPFLRLYPSSNIKESLLATTRDALYGWTATRMAIGQTAIGQSAYLYLFDHGYPAAAEYGLHAFHAAEIPYVFGTASRTPPYWPKIPDDVANRRLSDAMLGYWSSFARTGTPVVDGQPAWEAYGKAANYMAFAGKPLPGTRLMPGMFALHEAAVCRRRAAGDQPWNWNTGVASPVLNKATGCR